MTHDLLELMNGDLGAKVMQVVVSEIKGDIFYANVVLQRNGTTIERDSRPSDEIGLAVRTGAPIYADKTVVEKTVIELDAETGKPSRRTLGLRRL